MLLHIPLETFVEGRSRTDKENLMVVFASLIS